MPARLLDRRGATIMRNRASIRFSRLWNRYQEPHQLSCIIHHCDVAGIMESNEPGDFLVQIFAQKSEGCPLAWHVLRGVAVPVDDRSLLAVVSEVELACGTRCHPMEIRDCVCTGACETPHLDRTKPPPILP